MASWSARRPNCAEDWLTVRVALHRIANDALGHLTKLIHGRLDPDLAFRNLVTGSMQVWFVDGYLVVYEVGTPWYSDCKVLSELLVVRVEPGGTLTSVAHFLKQQAQAAGAEIIAVGTAFARSDRALSRLYQAEGFTPEAITLTMET